MNRKPTVSEKKKISLLLSIALCFILLFTACQNNGTIEQNNEGQNSQTVNNDKAYTTITPKEDTSDTSNSQNITYTPTNQNTDSEKGATKDLGDAVYVASTLEAAPSLSEPTIVTYDSVNPSGDFLRNFTLSSVSQILSKEEGNTCYSPISLFFPLALASLGASGDTQAEMVSALHLSGMSAEEIKEKSSQLFQSLYYTNETSTSLIANSLWLNKLYNFNEDFLTTASDHFYASLFTTDFSDPNAGSDMTEWIKTNTQGLLAPDIQVNEDNVLAIINTLYFKAHWSLTFDTAQTDTKNFHLSNGSDVTSEFINTSDTTNSYYIADDYMTATIPLLDLAGSVTFVLPNEGTTPKELMTTPEILTEILDNTSTDTLALLHYSLPKFSYDTKMDLIPALKDMGMELAFDPQNAQFDSIVTDTVNPIYVGQIEQGTHVGIDEEGIEAAAYTIMAFATTSLMTDTPPEINFVLDRPFAYVVRDRNENVLFIGEVIDPTLSE